MSIPSNENKETRVIHDLAITVHEDQHHLTVWIDGAAGEPHYIDSDRNMPIERFILLALTNEFGYEPEAVFTPEFMPEVHIE